MYSTLVIIILGCSTMILLHLLFQSGHLDTGLKINVLIRMHYIMRHPISTNRHIIIVFLLPLLINDAVHNLIVSRICQSRLLLVTCHLSTLPSIWRFICFRPTKYLFLTTSTMLFDFRFLGLLLNGRSCKSNLSWDICRRRSVHSRNRERWMR